MVSTPAKVGAHASHEQIRLGKKLRVGAVQRQNIVHQVAAVGVCAAGAVFPQNSRIERFHLLARPLELATVQDHRPHLGEARQQQRVEKHHQIVQVLARRDVGQDRADLIHHQTLNRHFAGDGPVVRPRVDVAAADVDGDIHAALETLAGIAPRQRLAQPPMLGAVQAGDNLRRANLLQEIGPHLLAAQEQAPLAMHLAIRLRSRDDGNALVEQTQLEHRPVALVTAMKQSDQVLGGGRGAAKHRQAGHLGNRLFHAPRRQRRGDRHRLAGGAHGVGDSLADQVQAPHHVDALGAILAFLAGQQAIQQAASGGQADEHDVARMRDVVAEQHAHDAQAHFLLRLAGRLPVRRRIAPGVEHPEREPQSVGAGVRVGLQDAGFAQPRQGARLDAFGVLGEATHPELGAALLGVRGDGRQGRIQQIVVERRLVHQRQMAHIGVDAAEQRQVHQQSARQGVSQLRLRRRRQLRGLLPEQQEHEFFGETQHRTRALCCLRDLRDQGSAASLGSAG